LTLPAGTAQARVGSYYLAPGWQSNAPIGAYQETGVQCTATCTGALCRFDITINWSETTANAVYFALYMDHVLWQGAMAVISCQANENNTTTLTYFNTPAAGSHTFGVGVFLSNAGMFTIASGAYSQLSVTEMRA